MSRESWMRMMDLNAWSFVAVTSHFIPAMLFQRHGKVVAVSARGAMAGAATMAVYAASKSALQRLCGKACRMIGWWHQREQRRPEYPRYPGQSSGHALGRPYALGIDRRRGTGSGVPGL
jgi:hypothetical protein